MSQPSSAPYPASTGDMTVTTVAAMAPTTAAPVTCHSARTERGRLCRGRSPACAWSSPVSSDDVLGGGVPGQDPGPPDRGPGRDRGRGGGGEEPPKRVSARLLLCWLLLRLPGQADGGLAGAGGGRGGAVSSGAPGRSPW